VKVFDQRPCGPGPFISHSRCESLLVVGISTEVQKQGLQSAIYCAFPFGPKESLGTTSFPRAPALREPLRPFGLVGTLWFACFRACCVMLAFCLHDQAVASIATSALSIGFAALALSTRKRRCITPNCMHNGEMSNRSWSELDGHLANALPPGISRSRPLLPCVRPKKESCQLRWHLSR